MFPDTSQSGILSDAQKGAFKSANNLGSLPEGGASIAGSSSLLRKAQVYSARHSTKGLGLTRPSITKTKPLTNIGRAIGRKRGY